MSNLFPVNTPHPAATSAAKFIDNTHAAGLGAIDPNIQAGLAQGPVAHPIMKSILTTVKNAAATAKTDIGHVFSDPSLQTAPTTVQKLQWHMTNTGIPAVANQDIASTQQYLINKGYAPGLKADGTWGSNWTQAMYAMHQAAYQKPGIGNTSVKSLAMNVLGAGLPTHALPLLMNVIAPTLHAIVHTLSLIAQPIVDIPTGQEFGLWGKNQPSLGDKVGAAIESLDRLTQHKNPQTAAEYMNTPVGKSDYINAVGTYFTVASMLSGAGEVGLAAKTGLAKAAEVGGGDVAKGLVTSMGAASSAPKFTFLNTFLPKVEGLTPYGNAQRRFLFSRTLQNMPVIGRMNGLLSKVTDPLATGAGHLWETTRIAAAVPRRLPLVAMGGDIASQVMNTGIKVGAIGAGENLFGDSNGPQYQTLEHLKPIAGPAGMALDLLSMGARAPLYRPGALASAQIGTSVEKMRQSIVDGLDQNGMITAAEKGLGVNFQDLVSAADKAGVKNPEMAVRLNFSNNISAFSATHAAQSILENNIRKGITYTDSARQKFMQDTESAIMHDPVKLAEARKSLISSDGLAQAYWAKANVAMLENPKFDQQKDFVDKLLSDQNFAERIMPHGQHILTPETLAKHFEQNPFDAKLPQGSEIPALNEGMDLASLGRQRMDNPIREDAQNTALRLGREYKRIDPSFDPESIITKPYQDAQAAAKADAADPSFAIKPTPKLKLDRNYIEENATEAEKKIHDEALHYLGQELGLNTKEMVFYSTEDLLKTIDAQSHRLPGGVTIPFDAPAALREAEDYQAKLGYRIVYGTDIGHSFLAHPFDLNALGSGQSKLARAAANVGMDFTKMNPETARSIVNSSVLKSIQQGLNDTERYPLGSRPAWATASNTLTYLRSVVQSKMNPVLRAEFSAAYSAGKFKNEAELVRKMYPDYTEPLVKAKVMETITKTSGPADWSQGDVVSALMKTGTIKIPVDIPGKTDKFMEIQGAGFNKETAVKFYDDLQKGLRSAPASVAGLKNPLSSALQSNFWLGGKELPIVGTRIPNITGDVRKAVIKFRFQGNPAFAGKRIVKTGLKGLTEGVPMTTNPTRTMEEMGNTKRYLALREQLIPGQTARDASLNEVDKTFASNDVINVYKPRDQEAYILGTLYDNAKVLANGGAVDIPRLLSTFHHVIDYGSLTAAEKSLNGIFFPFSFEKTVMRQLGGSLLDNSYQRLLVVAALNAYDSLGGQKAKKWMEDNAPLFKEVEKFNPFGHGVGLGQFGGIDRMYYDIGRTTFINMVGPKPVTTAATAAQLMNLIPAMRDLNNMLVGVDATGKKPLQLGGEVANTLHTSAWELGNKFNELGNWIKGGITHKGFSSKDFAPSGADNPYLPQAHLSYDQQQTDAWASRTAMLTSYSSYLDANEKGANWLWPASTPQVGGQKITRQSVSYLINHVFPAWDPTKAMVIVAAGKTAISKERGVIQAKSPALMPYYDSFVKSSDVISGYLAKDNYTTAKLAADTNTMRQTAIYLSEMDRTFYDFYKQYYESKYGPLEAMR